MSTGPADRRSTLGGIAAILLWSSTIAVTRSLSEKLGPFTAGACVSLAGASCFAITRFWQSRCAPSSASSPSRKYLWGCGGLFVAYTVALYWAVGLAQNRQQVLEVGLINYLWPALTLLISIPLLGHRVGTGTVPGTALALSGVLAVMTQGSDVSWRSFSSHFIAQPASYVLALLAALTWSLYSILARRWSGSGAGGSVERFIAATGLVLPLARFIWREQSLWKVSSAAEAVVMGAITALAYALWDQAMRKGDLAFVAACSYLTPLLSTLVTCAYLHVALSAQAATGAALIVVGSLVSWLSIRARSSSADGDTA